MNWKMKGMVGALGLVAVFLSWQFLDSLKISSSSPPTDTALTPDQLSFFTSSADSDKDGLLDREESIWGTDFQNPDTDGDGFLDGEEVSSGHNPTVAGPNDFIDGFNGENLSKRLQEMLVSGLTEGSLKPSADTFDSSTAAIADSLAEKLKEQATIPEPQIKIAANTSEIKIAYIQAVLPIMQSLPDDITPRSENPFIYPPAQRQKMAATLASLNDIKTPSPWASFHARLITVVASIDRAYALLATAETQQDFVTKLGINNQLADILYTTLPQVYDDFFAMTESIVP
jgi:hypothetical protein